MKTRIASFVITVIITSMVFACAPVQPLTKPFSTPAHSPTSAPTLAPTTVSTSRPIPTVPSDTEFHVNPIDGLNLDFIMGADVSMLGQIEQNGGKYYDQGNKVSSGMLWPQARPGAKAAKQLAGMMDSLKKNVLKKTMSTVKECRLLAKVFLVTDFTAVRIRDSVPVG